MEYSESSVRSLLLLLLLVVGRGVLSFVYTSLSPPLSSPSLSFLLLCSSLIGVPPSLSSSPLTLVFLRPLLLLVFSGAFAFNQDLSSWNVGKVTTMQESESSVRSLLLLLLVGRGVLSSVYTSLSPLSPLPLSPAAALLCSSLIGVPLSLFLSSHTGILRPLLLLVFFDASVFNQDLSSWNVGKVTTMRWSESSVRPLLLLLLLLVGRGVLSSVYTSLSPPLSSPSLSCCCCVLPLFSLLVCPPLSLPLLSHWSPPPPPPPSVYLCLRLQPGPVLVERRRGHDHGSQ